MGISSSPKVQVETYQLLLDIAVSLHTLISDKTALETMAKEAYSLPAAEAAIAKEARERIDEFKSAIAANEKLVANIDAATRALEQKKTDLMEQEKALSDRDVILSKKRREVEELIKKHGENVDALDKRDKEVNTALTQNIALTDELNKKNAALIEYESALKTKAAKLRDITETL